ncbi:MAG: cobalamin-dependent protein [Acidimicrobiia bacterium]|nr:cobalamin-dependent protein [Acidimicrobiia bacterium]
MPWRIVVSPDRTSLGLSDGADEMNPDDFKSVELALASTALDGDAGGVYRIASELMDNGVPFESVLFDYLIPTERSVGQRWAQGDYLVAEEHTVTAAIETVISLLTGMFDQPADGPLVVVTTAEGDAHSLPARAVSAHLIYMGMRTRFLGADVPAADFKAMIEAETPAAVVLSAAMTSHLLGAHAMVASAHELDVPVVVGGKAFGAEGEWAEPVGADAWVPTLHETHAVIESWVGGDRPEIRRGADFPEELQELKASRSSVLADADGRLTDATAPRLRDELRILLGAIEGSLLTGDDRVTAEALEWQRASLGAYGLPSHLVVDALHGALEAAGFDTAGAILHRTREVDER